MHWRRNKFSVFDTSHTGIQGREWVAIKMLCCETLDTSRVKNCDGSRVHGDRSNFFDPICSWLCLYCFHCCCCYAHVASIHLASRFATPIVNPNQFVLLPYQLTRSWLSGRHSFRAMQLYSFVAASPQVVRQPMQCARTAGCSNTRVPSLGLPLLHAA